MDKWLTKWSLTTLRITQPTQVWIGRSLRLKHLVRVEAQLFMSQEVLWCVRNAGHPMARRVLPRTVIVGPYTFAVIERDREWFDKNKLYGRMYSVDLTIEVCTEQPNTIILDTFIHELLHAVYFVCNIHDKDDEERTTTTLATGMSQLFISNPSVPPYSSCTQ